MRLFCSNVTLWTVAFPSGRRPNLLIMDQGDVIGSFRDSEGQKNRDITSANRCRSCITANQLVGWALASSLRPPFPLSPFICSWGTSYVTGDRGLVGSRQHISSRWQHKMGSKLNIFYPYFIHGWNLFFVAVVPEIILNCINMKILEVYRKCLYF